MSESKHTPGPWVAFEPYTSDNHGDRWMIFTGVEGEKSWVYEGACFIAEIACGDAVHEEANARLIASAPDLLAALLKLRRICSDIPAIEGNKRFAEANRAALAAITKAGGWS